MIGAAPLAAIAYLAVDLATFDGTCRILLQQGRTCTSVQQVGHTLAFIGIVTVIAVSTKPAWALSIIGLGAIAAWAGWSAAG